MKRLIFLDIFNKKSAIVIVKEYEVGLFNYFGGIMSVSVERLREVNKRLKEKLAQRESGEAQFTIDAKNLVDSSSVESVNKKLLDKIPPSLAKTIEIDETSDRARLQNLVKLLELYRKLEINKKAPELDKLFIYKAMNISGIGLKEEDFGEIREGKYVQIIAITYEPDKSGKKKAKNISLGYFGKAETLSKDFKNEIIEFVLRWRYEKAFQNLKHYKVLLSRLK